MMKRRLTALLCATLTLALCIPALAEPVDMQRQFVRGNSSFTSDSYETVWLTPIYANEMIAGAAPERFPTKFIYFPSPDGYCLTEYGFDKSTFLNTDSLMRIRYLVYDRGDFDMFLEWADDSNVLPYGDASVAVYTNPDKGSAHAMVELDEEFGSVAKLEIIIDNISGMATPDQLKNTILAEVERVQGEIVIEDIGHYWSENLINSVEIAAHDDPFEATVDVSGLSVTSLGSNWVVTTEQSSSGAKSIAIAISQSSRAHGEMGAKEGKLKNGTSYVKFTTDITGYATFVLTDKGNNGNPVYLTIIIDCAPDEFDAEVESAFGRMELRSLR